VKISDFAILSSAHSRDYRQQRKRTRPSKRRRSRRPLEDGEEEDEEEEEEEFEDDKQGEGEDEVIEDGEAAAERSSCKEMLPIRWIPWEVYAMVSNSCAL
jgi:hypothetical protein